MIHGVSGMSGQMEAWMNATKHVKQKSKLGASNENTEVPAVESETGESKSSKSGGTRKASAADTLSYDIAAINAVLSGKIADYNERLNRAKNAYDADSLRAKTQRDDALRKAYIAARQAGRVLPQTLAGKGAGGGLALQGTRRIRADYQNKRRTAEKAHEAEQSELQAAYEAEASKVRGLIAKAKAQAEADRIEAMAKAAKR